jgi:predicted nucleotidyltransferase
MKTTLDHLHGRKQEELETLVKLIRHATRVEMIILFGSYARGDFVDYDFRYDKKEEHYTSYESDFDIMVIVQDEKKANDVKIWYRLENQIRRKIPTPVSLIVEDIEHVNEQLSVGRYFYSDIKKEGKEKRLFELLKKAYVDARYSKGYKITKPELEYLAERVKKLRRLALKKCREKIKQFEKESTT